MGGADDANPLNRSLPAEVVTRRRRVEKRTQPEEPPLAVDQRVVLSMKPEQRVKWLSSALQRLQQGKVQSSSIYDILVHSKFPKDANEKTGVRMFRSICAHIAFFSSKQQRYLETESKLAQLFKDKAQGIGNDSDGAKARSSIGDGKHDIHLLMRRLLTLTPSTGQDLMDSLDGHTKDRLEALLQERITARARHGSSEGRTGGNGVRDETKHCEDSSDTSSSSDDRGRRLRRGKCGNRSRSRSRS